MKSFQEAVIDRRTNYAIGKNIPVLESQIIAAVERMVLEVPSAFNMQSARVVVAMNEHHDKVWEITKAELKKVVAPEKFDLVEEKRQGFAAGYGTILFFEDNDSVGEMQKKFAPYAKYFPIWASQANGMLQFAVWTLLEDMGLGVSLQHYNPLIDEEIKKYFKVPESWELVAEMVFGELLNPAATIEKIPVKERVKVFA